MKLAVKIVLLCLLPITVMAGVFCYFETRRDAAFFASDHERIALEFAEVLAPLIEDAWDRGGHDQVASDVTDRTVQFHHFTIRYVRFDEPVDKSVHPAATHLAQEMLVNQEVLTVTHPGADGRRRIHTYVPLTIEGSNAGLEVSRHAHHLERQKRSTLWATLLAFIVAALFCFAVALFGGIQMVGRPLRKLIEKAKRIGSGDFGQPVVINPNTNLGELASALNEMCEQLSVQRDQIESEEKSRQAVEEQLRHADRLKTVGRLAAGIAHEVGTPLNVLSGQAGLMTSGKLSDEEIREGASAIKEETERITKIIRELLDFARRSTPQRNPCSLKTIAEHTIGLLRSIAKEQNVQLEISSEGEDLIADIDGGQIRQVLTNLIVNAVQSIDGPGTVSVRLSRQIATASGAGQADYVRIDVQDTGSGISPADQSEIFEPFFTTKDVGQGTGLGLSISYGIVREHSGWIELTSTAGQGSCFSVFLPLINQTSPRVEASLE